MENLSNQRFGKLTAIKTVGHVQYTYRWLCRCDCGGEHIALSSNLKRGSSKQCRACANKQRSKHGHSAGNRTKNGRTGTYQSWLGMLARVRRQTPYLARIYAGISVCERWQNYENFLADMGERPPGRSIDRIDRLGNYEPGNCRWATATEQNRNKRNPGPVRAPGDSSVRTSTARKNTLP